MKEKMIRNSTAPLTDNAPRHGRMSTAPRSSPTVSAATRKQVQQISRPAQTSIKTSLRSLKLILPNLEIAGSAWQTLRGPVAGSESDVVNRRMACRHVTKPLRPELASNRRLADVVLNPIPHNRWFSHGSPLDADSSQDPGSLPS